MSNEGLLVVAGEASGDRIAALAVRALAGARAFGIAGPACRAAGVEAVASAEEIAAMGALDVALRLPALAKAMAALWARVRRSPPRAALLVNFTELNQRLGKALRARGIRVLWCVAPQVWAWRPGRVEALRGAIDRLAVILPFEEALWRDAGVDARYVGHPSLEAAPPLADGESAREAIRDRLGIAEKKPAIAILPGSRAGEVRRLSAALAGAAAMLRAEGSAADARLIVAPGLDARAAAIAARASREAGVAILRGDPEHGAAPLLGAFDVALSASGTASLEAALAGAAPIVTYRLDPAAYAIARRLVRTPHIALPNVLLGRRAFPELVQHEVTAARVAAAARAWIGRRDEALRLARELRAILAPPAGGSFGERVAALIAPWLA